MFVLFSHLLAFATLFVGAVSDLKTTEVPDSFFAVGVVGGILLHAAASYVTGSPEPLLWSLVIGAVFSVYGWGSYLLGMWGGADAFAMSVLGFATPYSLAGLGLVHSISVFVNVMLLGFIYTLGYAVYRAVKSGDVFRGTAERIVEEEKRISLEILAAALFAVLLGSISFGPFLYFGFLVFMILLFRFLKEVEASEMSRSIPATELEPGDVLSEDLGMELNEVREKSVPGRVIERIRRSGVTPGSVRRWLEGLENSVGYPEVVGLTGDDIERIEKSDVDEVKVRSGVRFVPVFPLALLLADAGYMGIHTLIAVVS